MARIYRNLAHFLFLVVCLVRSLNHACQNIISLHQLHRILHTNPYYLQSFKRSRIKRSDDPSIQGGPRLSHWLPERARGLVGGRARVGGHVDTLPRNKNWT
jgi:hypothetical protein